MKPLNITVKSKKFDANHAQWWLRLTNGSCRTFMCDTIHRRDTQSITVVAELAAIWTAFTQIEGYRWIEINCSRETETVLKWFLYGQPPAGYSKAYRHLSSYMTRHSVMVNPDPALYPMTTRIMDLNPAMRSRLRRASQLVTMGAVWRQREGYSCWTKSHPEHPYKIKRGESGRWECNCPDERAPTLTRNSGVQVCKHLLAAMITYRLGSEVEEPMRQEPLRCAV